VTLKPMCVVQATDLNDAWHQLILKSIEKDAMEDYLYSQVYLIDKGSCEGQHRLEIDTACVDIMHPGKGSLVPCMPVGKQHLAPTTMEQANQYMLYLMTDIVQTNEAYTYGQRIVPQLWEIIARYKNKGYNTNQATIVIAKPDDIHLDDPPCLQLIDTRIREGMLHFILYFRSWDLYNGFPVNLAGLQQLKAFMADEIGVEDGSIRAFSKGLHIYDDMWPMTKARFNLEEDIGLDKSREKPAWIDRIERAEQVIEDRG